jgi:hypothetical protein
MSLDDARMMSTMSPMVLPSTTDLTVTWPVWNTFTSWISASPDMTRTWPVSSRLAGS